MNKFSIGCKFHLGLTNIKDRWNNGFDVWIQTGEHLKVKTWFDLQLRFTETYLSIGSKSWWLWIYDEKQKKIRWLAEIHE